MDAVYLYYVIIYVDRLFFFFAPVHHSLLLLRSFFIFFLFLALFTTSLLLAFSMCWLIAVLLPEVSRMASGSPPITPPAVYIGQQQTQKPPQCENHGRIECIGLGKKPEQGRLCQTENQSCNFT